jgi:hypothetical protein
MPEQPAEADIPTAPRPSDGDLATLLRRLGVRFSGVYDYNGGAQRNGGFGGNADVDRRTGLASAELEDPIYNLEEPVYLHAAEARDTRTLDDISFTLHVDIDGPDTLRVVSGTVAAAGGGGEPDHFIGRVTSDTLEGDAHVVVVESFSFRWAATDARINRLELKLTGSGIGVPTAEATFVSATLTERHGPYILQQRSTHFREVEVDVDSERDATAVEPYLSTEHPDRPAGLQPEDLTLESVYGRAGIRLTRSGTSGAVIDNPSGGRWTDQELHDSMELHWEAFANRPQWRMWVFLAGLGETDTLGGIMFDGDIDEPGGVDRQGTAIFTRCSYFHSVDGEYIRANPPFEEAVRRELFFNLIHETGHAFNMAHSFQKQMGRAWLPPNWMTLESNKQALSFMNYPDAATPGGGAGANASWFYRRFGFRFDDGELLFMRHAPARFVEMGTTAWFTDHGRVERSSLDPRLELVVRSRKKIVELGEPVFVELRLRNTSDEPVLVHDSLHPSDGFVELAVTKPSRVREPFLAVKHTRVHLQQRTLQSGEAIYGSVNLSMGQLGFPFKRPGAYRIEASYTNTDETTAAAVMQLYVRPPANYDDVPVINELWNARVGRVLDVRGTRVMEDVSERLDWIRERLGSEHPASYYLTATRYACLATESKLAEPEADRVRVLEPDPEPVVQHLQPLIERPRSAADSMGHMQYREVVDLYTDAAQAVKDRERAQTAQAQLLRLFQDRGVTPAVVEEVAARGRELQRSSRR